MSARPTEASGPFASVSFLRLEDVLLAVWMAVAAPILVAAGHFRFMDTGRPVEGVLILVSVAAALLVFITPIAGGSAGRALGAFVGPLSGGVILVAATGFS